MNIVMAAPRVVPGRHLQTNSLHARHSPTWPPAPVSEPLAHAVKAFRTDMNGSRPAAVTGAVINGRAEPAGVSYTAPALQYRAQILERLICEAETTLASQTARTYRCWYACWRHRGVRVNDLLDMTWAWRQRARDD